MVQPDLANRTGGLVFSIVHFLSSSSLRSLAQSKLCPHYFTVDTNAVKLCQPGIEPRPWQRRVPIKGTSGPSKIKGKDDRPFEALDAQFASDEGGIPNLTRLMAIPAMSRDTRTQQLCVMAENCL